MIQNGQVHHARSTGLVQVTLTPQVLAMDTLCQEEPDRFNELLQRLSHRRSDGFEVTDFFKSDLKDYVWVMFSVVLLLSCWFFDVFGRCSCLVVSQYDSKNNCTGWRQIGFHCNVKSSKVCPAVPMRFKCCGGLKRSGRSCCRCHCWWMVQPPMPSLEEPVRWGSASHGDSWKKGPKCLVASAKSFENKRIEMKRHNNYIGAVLCERGNSGLDTCRLGRVIYQVI